MTALTALPPAHLTADVPGIGGVIRQRPEDFFVDEIPAYEPCGIGEHLYLHIEKREVATLDAVARIARHFRLQRNAVGYAGMKDKHAVTRQWVSVYTRDDSPLQTLNIVGITVLNASRHGNKLRLGHLRGNRFRIRIRGVDETATTPAQAVVDRLAGSGVPNFFGPQRFGRLGRNHLIGRACVLQEWTAACALLLGGAGEIEGEDREARTAHDEGRLEEAAKLWPGSWGPERHVARRLAAGDGPERAFLSLHPAQRQFYISAFQSAVFNAVTAQRLADDRLDSLSPGDVAARHDNGAMFRVENEADDTLHTRLQALEISPTGPLWGHAMLRAGAGVDDAEVAALHEAGVEPEAFSMPPLDVRGARRALRVPLREAVVEPGADEHGTYLEVRFALPAGAFATTALREIMKPEDSASVDSEDTEET